MSELHAGDDFVFAVPEHVESVWGDGDRVAWAAGEPLYLVGPPGVGKTTLLQQLVLRRIGATADLGLLDLTVTPDPDRVVLYIAADRPRQIARSFRRMVAERDKRALNLGLQVWVGPLPFDLAREPQRLCSMAEQVNAGTVCIDSLKDVAVKLADDETGARVNQALQQLVAAGIEVVVNHHQRKATSDNRKPATLADVYGSTWLTSGAGSVLLVWGQPGDAIVEVSHLKQPAADIGPLTVIHDHENGASRIHEPVDLEDALTRSRLGLAATDAARLLYGVTTPDRNQVEKARRRLNKLYEAGNATRYQGDDGEVRYVSARDTRDPQRDDLTQESRAVTITSNPGSRTPHAPHATLEVTATPFKGARDENVTPINREAA